MRVGGGERVSWFFGCVGGGGLAWGVGKRESGVRGKG